MEPKGSSEQSTVLQVVKQLPGAVTFFSFDELRVKYMSDAARAYLPEEFKDKDVTGVRFADLVWNGERNPSVAVARQISESGKGEEIKDLQIINKDGRKFWVDWIGVPMPNGTGRWDVLLHLMDISQRKEMERELKEANDELEAKVEERTFELKRSNEELQQFAYVASHDLREPLRMIESYLGLLQKRYQGKVLDEKAEEFIDFTVDGAERMQEMISDLLAYSRIDTRGKPFSLVSMKEVLAIALKDLKTSLAESGTSITDDNLPSIMGDRMQMVLLLENLIGNSIKFRDVEAPQIHITAQSRGNNWVFSIQDNGIGIAKDQQEHIFQMFQRLHTKEEYQGTGIGLAIAKKIVERHGGRIWVESDGESGSTFFFTIPKIEENVASLSTSSY